MDILSAERDDGSAFGRAFIPRSYNDDCYIEDDGGSYYLVDLIHPDIRVMLIVVAA